MLEKEGVHGSGSEEGPVSGGQEKVREQAIQIATKGCPRKWGSKDKVWGVCLETERARVARAERVSASWRRQPEP